MYLNKKLKLSNYENYEREYWGMYSTEELKRIVDNGKLLQDFTEKARRQLELRTKKQQL